MTSSGAFWIVTEAGSGVLAQTSLEIAIDALRVGVAALSLLLMTLSLSAFRRTKLRGLAYATASFGLFAVLMLFEFLEDLVAGPFGPPYSDAIGVGITFAILLLFFLAIVKGKEPMSQPTSTESGPPP